MNWNALDPEVKGNKVQLTLVFWKKFSYLDLVLGGKHASTILKPNACGGSENKENNYAFLKMIVSEKVKDIAIILKSYYFINEIFCEKTHNK